MGGLIAGSMLGAHAEAAGLLTSAVGDAMLAARDALILACAAQIGMGQVKITTIAAETQHHLPNPLVEIRPGAPPSAAADAAALGIGALLPIELERFDG